MANSNYIGNSKISEEPKEVLRLTIVEGAITTPKIADEAVTEEKLSQDVKEKLNTQTAEIEDNAVTTPKIANGAITEGKLSQEVKSKINKQVSTADIADGAVTEEKLSKELYTVHLMEQIPSVEAPLPGYSERRSMSLTPKKQLFYDGIVEGFPEKIENGVYTYNLNSWYEPLMTDMIAYLDRKGGSAIQYDSNIKCIKLTPGQVFITFPKNVEVYCIIVTAAAVKRSSSVGDTTITPGLFKSSVSMEAISDNVEESPGYMFSFDKSHLESIKDPTTNRYQVITDNWGSDECGLYLKFTVGYNIKPKPDPSGYWYVGTTKPTSLSECTHVSDYLVEQTYTNNSGEKAHIFVLTNSGITVTFINNASNMPVTQEAVDTTTIPGYNIFETAEGTANGGSIKILLDRIN